MFVAFVALIAFIIMLIFLEIKVLVGTLIRLVVGFLEGSEIGIAAFGSAISGGVVFEIIGAIIGGLIAALIQ